MHADGALGVDDLADLGNGSGVDLGVAVSEVGLRKKASDLVSPERRQTRQTERTYYSDTSSEVELLGAILKEVESDLVSTAQTSKTESTIRTCRVTQTPCPSSMTARKEAQRWKSASACQRGREREKGIETH